MDGNVGDWYCRLCAPASIATSISSGGAGGRKKVGYCALRAYKGIRGIVRAWESLRKGAIFRVMGPFCGCKYIFFLTRFAFLHHDMYFTADHTEKETWNRVSNALRFLYFSTVFGNGVYSGSGTDGPSCRYLAFFVTGLDSPSDRYLWVFAHSNSLSVGMQSSIVAFARADSFTSSIDEPVQKSRSERLADNERRGAIAASMNLPWPRKTVRKVGRPSRQNKLEDACYRHIENDTLPEGTPQLVPKEWDGTEIVSVAEMVRNAGQRMVSAQRAEPVETLVIDGDVGGPCRNGDDALADDVKPKRQKVHLDPELIDFFFSFCDAHKNWSKAFCLRQLQGIAPELFGTIHPCTIHR